MRRIFLAFALGLMLCGGHVALGEANEYFLYSGTYTGCNGTAFCHCHVST